MEGGGRGGGGGRRMEVALPELAAVLYCSLMRLHYNSHPKKRAHFERTASSCIAASAPKRGLNVMIKIYCEVMMQLKKKKR